MMRWLHVETDTTGGVRVLYVYLGRMRIALYRSNDDYRSLCVEVALS